jgi:hypothetical protein
VRSRLLVAITSMLVLGCFAPAAKSSQLIDRNATNVSLQISTTGQALLTYTADGQLRHVLAWGAVGARAPTPDAPQVKFTLDYAGGWGHYRREVWKTFRNGCRPYTGPALAWLVTACTAPDGSYWAVQSFPQALPDLGFTPWLPAQRAWWLELSHWTGPLAKIEVWNDWVYNHRYQQLFGQLTYRGQPVYGFGTTGVGAPTDGYGRLLYLDTLDSAYGPGWHRENSFVSHNPTGVFCYGFYPFDPSRGGYEKPPGYTGPRGPGAGRRYRITVEGPGVTPIVTWQGPGFHPFNPADPSDATYDRTMTSLLHHVIGTDKQCRQGHD